MSDNDVKSPPPRPPRLQFPLSSRSRVGDSVQTPLSLVPELSSNDPPIHPIELSKPPYNGTDACNSPSGVNLHSPPTRLKSIHRREGADPVSFAGPSHYVLPVHHPICNDNANASDLNLDGEMLSQDKNIASECNHEASSISETVDSSPKYQRHQEGKIDKTPIASSKQSMYNGRSAEPDSLPSSPLVEYTAHQSSHDFGNGFRSKSRYSANSQGRPPSLSHHTSGTPSPWIAFRHKIKSQNPPAMFCAEIASRNTPLERCILYAQKINELYLYDSGLEDWTIETRHRANAHRPTIALTAGTITPQPRHVSGGSTISEVTFPLRPDASLATDLSGKPQDFIPTLPPKLPYPSLVQHIHPHRSLSATPSHSSSRSYSSLTPSVKAGGFFSSLGRKASLSKKDKTPVLMKSASMSTAASVTKHPPIRAVNISNTPSVPGGPRAAPHHRLLRSKTLLAPAAKKPLSEPDDTRSRRPSSELAKSPGSDVSSDPSFLRQVDKLADLLPHADRTILAGYLRRSGQDILAIGQYLDDEKNGTLKTWM